MKLSKPYLRSAEFQLYMLGGVLLGAVVLAILALCLRNVVFEVWVHEPHPPLPKKLRTLARAVAAGRAKPERLEALGDAELDLIYGAWIDEPQLDPHGILAKNLHARAGLPILARIRGTLVVGNLQQRLRAMELLAWLPRGKYLGEVHELSGYAMTRGRRRHEPDLERLAQELWRRSARDSNPGRESPPSTSGS